VWHVIARSAPVCFRDAAGLAFHAREQKVTTSLRPIVSILDENEGGRKGDDVCDPSYKAFCMRCRVRASSISPGHCSLAPDVLGSPRVGVPTHLLWQHSSTYGTASRMGSTADLCCLWLANTDVRPRHCEHLDPRRQRVSRVQSSDPAILHLVQRRFPPTKGAVLLGPFELPKLVGSRARVLRQAGFTAV
jgi:hypothetical protein